MRHHPWIGCRVETLHGTKGHLVAIGERIERRAQDDYRPVLEPKAIIATDGGFHVEESLIFVSLERKETQP